jgi:2-keto-4-pentenoate hydratase/2-oxohepta-3-ene-1,7-dioic acid hydratase in catechol pathway
LSRYVQFDFSGIPSWGRIEDDQIVLQSGTVFGAWRDTSMKVPLEGARLFAPAEPKLMLGVGLNFRSHLQGRSEPSQPELFLKAPGSLLAPGGDVRIPDPAADVHAEGELVLVIRKRCQNLTPENAMRHVLGFTIGNDVSARAWQQGDLQWWRAKGSDTFAPLGPWVDTEFDWRASRIVTRIDGEIVQEGDLSDMVFDPIQVLVHASRHMTLDSGDCIFMGTPGHTRRLVPGQRVSIEIPGLGVLEHGVSG